MNSQLNGKLAERGAVCNNKRHETIKENSRQVVDRESAERFHSIKNDSHKSIARLVMLERTSVMIDHVDLWRHD